jgi:hypothetical protein
LGVPGTAAAQQAWNPEEISELDAAAVVKPWRHGFLPITADQYLAILERTVRGLATEHRAQDEQSLASLLQPLGIPSDAWFAMLDNFESWFHVAVGSADRLLQFAARTGKEWLAGLSRCRECFE